MSDSYKIYASKDYVDGKGLPDGAGAYQQLVTGADSKAVWEARTHYTTVETLFNWDGDQTGLNESSYTQMYMRYCGPFDDLNGITGGNIDWFLGTTLVTSDTGGGYYYVGSQSNEFEHTIKEADIYSTGASSYGIWGNGAQTPIVWVSEEDVGTTIQLYSSADGSSTYPCTFTSSGFWIGKYNTSPGVATIEYRNTTTLPENYLPTTIPVIQSAQVGQTVVVKAVDENGKPTEWEAVDVFGEKSYVTYYGFEEYEFTVEDGNTSHYYTGFTPQADTEYVIVFDGNEYYCTSDSNRNFGNASLFSADLTNSGEPFYVYWEQQNHVSIYCAAGVHNITIYAKADLFNVKSPIVTINGTKFLIGDDGGYPLFIPY